VEKAGDGLQVRLSDQIALPVPPARTGRYGAAVGQDSVLFGIRPEHLTETRQNGAHLVGEFDALLEVIEPMGNETMVYFSIDGTEVCGRVGPNTGARVGERLRIAAHLENMHLIDDASGRVL
ncbi:MAG: TOBE domain-containing protein, partial [Rhizobiales bacterium]|nr:TOBE domain-containing protein [Hyphomicrobiales bacterium]